MNGLKLKSGVFGAFTPRTKLDCTMRKKRALSENALIGTIPSPLGVLKALLLLNLTCNTCDNTLFSNKVMDYSDLAGNLMISGIQLLFLMHQALSTLI